MIILSFYIRYQTQLRRTRPMILQNLNNALLDIFKESGAKLITSTKSISASYDEAVIAFRLDIVSAIESLSEAVKKAAPELFGYSLAIYSDTNEVQTRLFQTFSKSSNKSYVWCDETAYQHLSPYFLFDTAQETDSGPWYAISGIQDIPEAPAHPDSIKQLDEDTGPCTAVLGPEGSGKRNLISRYIKNKYGNELAPFIIRYGVGGTHCSCFTDALPDTFIQSIKKEQPDLYRSFEYIHRNRLRSESPSSILDDCEKIMKQAVDSYLQSSASESRVPVLVLEDIHAADAWVRDLSLRLSERLLKEKKARLFISSSEEQAIDPWHNLDVQTVKLHPSKNQYFHFEEQYKNLSSDFWELSYTLYKAQPFFPRTEALSLLCEEGKNSKTVSNAIAVLAELGLISSVDNPYPRHPAFEEYAEKRLGKRIDILIAFLRRRLMHRIHNHEYSASYAFLRSLKTLGGSAAEDIVLDAVYKDVVDGTYRELMDDIQNGRFALMVGTSSYSVLAHLIHCTKTLYHADCASIRTIANTHDPEVAHNSSLYAYIMTNRGALLLSAMDHKVAASALKEAIVVLQSRIEAKGLARAYRIFALMHLSKQKVSDAIEYIFFAMDAAERSKDISEKTLCSYFSAQMQFIFGNISKAENLAARCESYALEWGQASWAAKARFLQGRFRFETGRYRDAAHIFAGLSALAPEEARPLVKAWLFRSMLYNGDTIALSDLPETTDSSLFKLEAACFSSTESEDLIIDLDSVPVKQNEAFFIFTDQADWRSGYAQCELLLFPSFDVINRLESALYSLLLCRRNQEGDRESALRRMEYLLRDERIPEADPHDSVYYYAFFKVMEENTTSEVDKNTILNMALKKSQQRSGRIESSEAMHAYNELHYWPRSILYAAKKNNLI